MTDLIAMLQSSSRDMLIAFIGALGGGGLFLGITALLKVRPERGRIIVESAGAVVVMQKDLIDDLQEQLGVLRGENDVLRQECANLRTRVRSLELQVLQIDQR